MEKNFAEMADLIPAKNDSDYKRILAIGDIHASFDKLISLWEKISVTDEDLVIFLGDYFQGGDKNLKTLRWPMEHNKLKNIVMLLGNTDEDFLYYLKSLRSSTLEESMLINEMCDFIKSLPLYYKIKIGGRDYFFCHGGINPKKPLDKQSKSSLVGADIYFFLRDYSGEAVIVIGHKSPRKVMKKFPQYFELDTLKPARVPNKNILLLDTRAKDFNGYLSCVDILTGEFWQN